MSEPAPDIAEEDQLLAAAAKMEFAAMRHIHGQLIESTDPAVISTLSHAYARHSRCMRQNLACLQRQKAERARAQRAADQHEVWMARRRPSEDDLHGLAVEARTREVQDAVDRVISAAAQGDRGRHTEWAHRFDREADDWSERPDWLEDDLDVVVSRACAALELPGALAARWRELPEPDFTPEPAPATPEEVAAANAVARDLMARYRAASGADLAPARRFPPGADTS